MDSPFATSYATPFLGKSLSMMVMPGHSPAGMTVTHAPESTVTSGMIPSSGFWNALMPLLGVSSTALIPRFGLQGVPFAW